MVKNIKRILIAEDSYEWQKFHVQLLNAYDKSDIEFLLASSGREALEIAQKNKDNPFSLVISDMQMETEFLPQFAGEWFIKNLKDIPEYKNVPVVVISAAYNISFIAHSLGVNYLSKRSLVNNPQAYYFMLDEYFS